MIPLLYFGGLELASPYTNGTAVFLIAVVAFAVSLGHIVLLGIPGLILLWKLRKFAAWSIGLIGFLEGCLPIGVWSWPLKSSLKGATDLHWDGHKMVSSIVDGVPTAHGWISYGEGVITMGALGALSGLAFWLAWSRSEFIPEADES